MKHLSPEHVLRAVDEHIALNTVRNDNREGDREESHAEALARTGFWGARGAGAIIVARDTGRLLLPLRSLRVEQPGTWGTWGGAVDPGETPEEAARREVEEEVGYLGAFTITPLYVFRRGTFAYHNFLVIVPHGFEPELNWETDEYAWVSIDALPEPMHFGLRALLADPASRAQIGRVTRREL